MMALCVMHIQESVKFKSLPLLWKKKRLRNTPEKKKEKVKKRIKERSLFQ